MKISSVEFELSAPDLASCPPESVPEIALIGRSNVGKSSLVNFLAGKHNLARVSATPGRTRIMNFYLVNSAFRLVDLPGYGYSKIARANSEKFHRASADYMVQRPTLATVLALIDSRLSPQGIDVDFISWLAEQSVPFVLVFTKADKLSPSALRANQDLFFEAISGVTATPPAALACSAKNGKGRQEILHLIDDLCNPLGKERKK